MIPSTARSGRWSTGRTLATRAPDAWMPGMPAAAMQPAAASQLDHSAQAWRVAAPSAPRASDAERPERGRDGAGSHRARPGQAVRGGEAVPSERPGPDRGGATCSFYEAGENPPRMTRSSNGARLDDKRLVTSGGGSADVIPCSRIRPRSRLSSESRTLSIASPRNTPESIARIDDQADRSSTQ